mgnify:CR=1 FL=1
MINILIKTMFYPKALCMSLGARAPCFFDPGDFGPGPGGRHRPDPDVKIWRSKGLNPSYNVVFYGDQEKQH